MSTTTLDAPPSKPQPLPPSRGKRVCAWIEANCVLGEGDYFGQPFRLLPFQRRFLWNLYELNPDGTRRYRTALLGLPKNNGKTPLAAAIAAYELAGGEHTSPIVVIGAASFDQADLAFGDLKAIFRESPTLSGYAEVNDTEILLKDQPGRAYRVAAARGTNDGQRPSCFIADELHEWNDGAREGAHLVLANGTTKRANSLQLNITTAGSDQGSLLGRMYLHGKEVLAGKAVDPTLLFQWHEAAEDVDVTDPASLRAALRSCNPAADHFLDVEQVARRFAEIPEFEARRYFLNQWTRSAESWLPAGTWSRCQGDATIPAGAEVVAGVDVALYHDSTAVVVAHRREDGTTAVQAKVWRPVNGEMDVTDVMAHLRSVADNYDLKAVAYDPRFFDLPAKQLFDEGIPMLEVPQSPERMVPACGLAYEEIVAGRVVHDGDPILEDHVLSAAQRSSERGWTLSKGKSKRKIDACIAMVLALWQAHQRAEAEVEPWFSLA